VLLTDFHPCCNILSTDGHLPPEKLGIGKQNSQYNAVVPSIMLTYNRGLSLQQAEMFVAFPHSGNDKGVNLSSGVEIFHPGTRGNRQVPKYPIFWITQQYLYLPKFLQLFFVTAPRLGPYKQS
jgi:hypothetical protein